MEAVVLKSKPRNRRGLRRNQKSKYQSNLSFVGANGAGISSKFDSFDNMLKTLLPSVFFLQETKVKQQGRIKTSECGKYQIFELIRKDKQGGGLAIGALHDVNPVWISKGDDEVEILVVEISVENMKIRCVCGYGPQEYDKTEKKEKFWAKLSSEVKDASLNEACLIIQMDGNLWGGPELVKNDPNQCNNNGKMFKTFLEDNPQLTIANNLDSCEGSLTRVRKTSKKVEESILDFFLICDTLKHFVTQMVVDEEKMFALSRYSKIFGKVNSDHNTLILNMNIQIQKKKPGREEFFNFRNKECQEIFHDLTNNAPKLNECFQQGLNISAEGEAWFKNLNKLFHQSFRKVRFTGKVKETELSRLFDQRRTILQKLKSCEENLKENFSSEIKCVEAKITDLVAEENRNKVIENFQQMSNPDGAMNTNGMWKLTKKMFPKNRETLPFAKKDFDGHLITSQNGLKSLYIETFVHRLRDRPIKDNLKHLRTLKEELCAERITFCKLVNRTVMAHLTLDWKMHSFVSLGVLTLQTAFL